MQIHQHFAIHTVPSQRL